MLAIAASGLPIDRITVILGALGVGIGLGLQGIVNNFVSGIILIFDRTLRIGDTVQIGDKKGRVKEISLRSSTLLTDDGAEIIIPNGFILSQNIVNWTLSNNNTRLELNFTIDKLIELEQLKKWMAEIPKEMNNIVELRNPEVYLTNLTSWSMNLKTYYWVGNISRMDEARSRVLESLYRKFNENGIKIV